MKSKSGVFEFHGRQREALLLRPVSWRFAVPGVCLASCSPDDDIIHFQPGAIALNHVVMGMAFTLGLMAAMLLFLEIGRRLGGRHRAKDAEGAREGLGAVEGAVFGLMSLLLAFTFSGAASRFDARRHLIVEETNAIGTAYLRLDVLPPGRQPALRDAFRRYVDARLAVYRRLPDFEAARVEMARATALQGEIWSQAVAACQETGTSAVNNAVMTLVLSSLNQMIDITTTRTVALRTHPPPVVYAMLGVVALASSLLAGYGMAGGGKRSWLHILGFVAMMAITAYVILDFEYPRIGLVRIDAVDQLLVDLRDSMK